jgi:hypothetical protein
LVSLSEIAEHALTIYKPRCTRMIRHNLTEFP